uniref:FLYWCH-type domain-containing protein n=1 Tax=Trichuris muris TaxID=70415 RepID=A0A5S6QP73_TRIMR
MYTFEKLNRSETIKFWRCDKRYLDECKATVHAFVTAEVIKEVNEHTHDSDPVPMEVTAVCNTIKRPTEETTETPAMIINEVCAETSTVTLTQLSSSEAMKMIIRRKRRTVQGAPPQPIHRASIVVPELYQIHREEERFLLYGSGVRYADRILIFGRQSHSVWSGYMKTLYADGTF